jgi:group II intron reverse transcriptase/maturase
MTVEAFEAREAELLERIQHKLKSGTYRFKPGRSVRIPKPGTRKQRRLEIPTVADRVVSQSLHMTLEEIFDPGFTSSNFGFRRGKSQHQAIRQVRRYVVAGYEWCASIDLQSFFDEIPHDLMLRLIRRKVADEQVVTLVARALKAGVREGGKTIKSSKGCPQGSPVSPILSNIALNELDQELERRGHKYCRWADDFVILVRSERSAMRVMISITTYLEETLKLPVNADKSQVALVKHIEFLGFQVRQGKIGVGKTARQRFKDRVRDISPRNNGKSMGENIQQLNAYIRGWVEYFRIQQFKTLFKSLDGFIRSRLRSMQLKKWKKPKKFQRIMIRAGIRPQDAHRTWVKMTKWQSVHRRIVHVVLNNRWFRRQGLTFLDDFTQQQLQLRLAH